MNPVTQYNERAPRRRSHERPFLVDTVIVPLDGSMPARAALPVARTLARVVSATLHVVYVGDALAGPRDTLQELGLTGEEIRGAVLDRRSGDPARAIAELARELPAPLIVMCTHTGGDRPDTSLGSVAEGVLLATSARVLLVSPGRGHHEWTLRRVLLAHDGSPSADATIAPAADLSRSAGAEVIALHVASGGEPGPSEPGSLPAPRYLDQPQHEWPSWAHEFVERMLALGAPTSALEVKLLVAGGQIGSEIAQYARENAVDLVIVPWKGTWHSERLGAMRAIVSRSGCPVLLLCTRQQPGPTPS